MSQFETVIAELDHNIASYVPAESVRSLLGKVSFVGAIGPTATGKSTAIRSVIGLYPGIFKFARSHTTRAPRAGELDMEDMYFDGDTLPVLRNLAEQVRNGEIVQIKRHDTTGHYYWTEPKEYIGDGHSIMPILASEYTRLRSPKSNVRFASQIAIMFTCRPDVWSERVRERYGNMNDPQVRLRIQEGFSALRWGLDQGDTVHWVDTTGDNEYSEFRAAKEVMDITTSTANHAGNLTARVMGQRLLAHLQILGGAEINL